MRVFDTITQLNQYSQANCYKIDETPKSVASFIKRYRGKYFYLRGANLNGVNLSGAKNNRRYICGANLRDSDCRGTDFSDGRLICIDFRGANCSGAKFVRQTLSSVDFRGSILCDTDFTNAKLRSVDFRGAIFNDALFGAGIVSSPYNMRVHSYIINKLSTPNLLTTDIAEDEDKLTIKYHYDQYTIFRGV